MYGENYRRDLFNHGLAVNLAFGNPKKLGDLLHEPKRAPRNEDLPPGPIRIPRRS